MEKRGPPSPGWGDLHEASGVAGPELQRFRDWWTEEAALTRQADAQEAVEQVLAVSLVQARSRGTLVDLYLTEPPF